MKTKASPLERAKVFTEAKSYAVQAVRCFPKIHPHMFLKIGAVGVAYEFVSICWCSLVMLPTKSTEWLRESMLNWNDKQTNLQSWNVT